MDVENTAACLQIHKASLRKGRGERSLVQGRQGGLPSVARYLGHLHAMLHAHGNRIKPGFAAAANWPKRRASFSRRFARCFSCAGDWPA